MKNFSESVNSLILTIIRTTLCKCQEMIKVLNSYNLTLLIKLALLRKEIIIPFSSQMINILNSIILIHRLIQNTIIIIKTKLCSNNNKIKMRIMININSHVMKTIIITKTIIFRMNSSTKIKNSIMNRNNLHNNINRSKKIVVMM